MNIIRHKRGIVILSFLCSALLAASCYYWWQYNELKLRVKFADEQMHLFTEMRAMALQNNAVVASGNLYYVMHYYPSGTKQKLNSHLDRIVERERANIVQEIMTHLRATSDKDLGDDPKAWFDAYVPDFVRNEVNRKR